MDADYDDADEENTCVVNLPNTKFIIPDFESCQKL